jgi:hypothetical protein
MVYKLHKWQDLPEYPHSPAAHLNKPTAININGRTSHCDMLRAGQRKAVSGYAGRVVVAADRPVVDDPTEETWLAPPFPGFLAFRLGLWGEGPVIVPAMLLVSVRTEFALLTIYLDRVAGCGWNCGFAGDTSAKY